jgi:lipoprotein-anchoring transpeptidase ErfK/SrfK
MMSVRRPRVRATVGAAIAGSVAVTAVALGDGRLWNAAPAPAANIEAIALPHPVQPAFTPPAPRRLDAQSTYAWAPVRRAASARSRPDPGSRVVDTIATKTPEGTDNVVLVLGRRADDSGRLWVKVRIPALPNNATAWVDRSALGGYVVVDTRLEIDLERLKVTLYRDGRPVFAAPAGVGKPRWPTPRGDFYVRNKLTDFASPAYGPLAFGTSARSPVLTDWPGGGFIGIHGTNQPWLIPGRVSHGCVRLRNRDILRLGELMPIGTPVTIR